MLTSWNSDPFNEATNVDEIDLFTTDGVSSTFPVVNKDISDVGSTLQYSNVQKNQYNGGFTKNSNSVTLDSVPPGNLQGIIPGMGALVLSAYDNTNVIANGNIETQPFFLGDVDDIVTYGYKPRAGTAGISITLVNNITSITPDLSWVQLACSNAAGSALTYQATGTTLYTDQLNGFSTLAASSHTNVLSLTIVIPASTNYFVPGDFVYINPGTATQEILQTSAKTNTTLTLAASTTYQHFIGEPVYSCARKFWMQYTVPINATNNVAANYYNISYKVDADQIQRT